MNKYEDLINILDTLCREAPESYSRYHPNNDSGKLLQARSRAYIHLFLKVKFGLMSFLERENYVTDDPGDAGVDAYFIDKENRKLYFIQSKFRNTTNNFENKEITLEELLAMDVERIMEGEDKNEQGDFYNNKIKNLIAQLQIITDLPRYSIKVIILANVNPKLNKSKLNRITCGYEVEVYNNERVYSELVFPLISGTYYDIKELKISINIDRENSNRRIEYDPMTRYGECTVTALFVPTIEIAKILSKYKNSILKYNPRSYLDLAAGSVNEKIAKSITDINTNEFALFNNGITLLSDETVYSDKVGKKNKAEIIITNPQIINGGQTAYTLSVLYEKFNNEELQEKFRNKDVLLKIISLCEDDENSSTCPNQDKLKLIEEISIATNQQNEVSEADRRANDKVQIELQELIYRDFGLFYERKRGEFGDGIRNKYIDRKKIIDREHFMRVCLASNKEPVKAFSGSTKAFFEKTNFDKILPNSSQYRKYVYLYMLFQKLKKAKYKDCPNIHLYAKFSIIMVVSDQFLDTLNLSEYEDSIDRKIEDIKQIWPQFEQYALNSKPNKDLYFKDIIDKSTGEKRVILNWPSYYKGKTIITDLITYFKL